MSKQKETGITKQDGKPEYKAKRCKKVDSSKSWLTLFLREFRAESDRASVILTCAMLDEALRELLTAALLDCSTSEDPLFDGANAPLSTFSSRIEMAFRLGLVSRTFAKCLHMTRKIRNTFAHDVAGCKFDSHSVTNRIHEMKRSCHYDQSGLGDLFPEGAGIRDEFCLMEGWFIWQIKRKTGKIKTIDDAASACCIMKKNAKIEQDAPFDGG